jgi:hypothetical protein
MRGTIVPGETLGEQSTATFASTSGKAVKPGDAARALLACCAAGVFAIGDDVPGARLPIDRQSRAGHQDCVPGGFRDRMIPFKFEMPVGSTPP